MLTSKKTEKIFIFPLLSNLPTVNKMENDLSKLTVEQLKQRLKPLTFITGVLTGVLLLLLGITIYKSLASGQMTPLLATPIALSPIAIANFVRIGRLKKEMKSRGGQ